MHYVFRYMFMQLENSYSKELEIIRHQYPSEPPQITENPLILHWHDAIDLLAKEGHEVVLQSNIE